MQTSAARDRLSSNAKYYDTLRKNKSLQNSTDQLIHSTNIYDDIALSTHTSKAFESSTVKEGPMSEMFENSMAVYEDLSDGK